MQADISVRQKFANLTPRSSEYRIVIHNFVELRTSGGNDFGAGIEQGLTLALMADALGEGPRPLARDIHEFRIGGNLIQNG